METSQLHIAPITITQAKELVRRHHRTHPRPPRSGLFAIGLMRDGVLIGAAIIGRPISRHLDDGFTAEVTRVVVPEGVKNGCSMLLGACGRASRAMGYRRTLTYSLPSESGSSLRAAGWRLVGETKGGRWSRAGRPRLDTHPRQAKLRWEAPQTP